MSANSATFDQLNILEREFRDAMAGPAEALPSFMDGWLPRLKYAARSGQPGRCAKLLTDAAFQLYLQGDRPPDAAAPIALAVLLAERQSDHDVLRRALIVQGLVLSVIHNTSAALDSLKRALDLSEQHDKHAAVAVAWMNIGICFLEATLDAEAAPCFIRAAEGAEEQSDQTVRRSFAARSYWGLSLCRSNRHDFAAALDWVRRGSDTLGAPWDHEHEQVKSLMEAHCGRILIRLGRIDEAQGHIALAQTFAERSGARRALLGAKLAAGLLAVFRGRFDSGIQALLECKVESGALTGALHDTLRDLTMAYDAAGRPDAALGAYRELIADTLRSRLVDLRYWVDGQGGRLQMSNFPEPMAAAADELNDLASRFRARLALVSHTVPSNLAGT